MSTSSIQITVSTVALPKKESSEQSLAPIVSQEMRRTSQGHLSVPDKHGSLQRLLQLTRMDRGASMKELPLA